MQQDSVKPGWHIFSVGRTGTTFHYPSGKNIHIDDTHPSEINEVWQKAQYGNRAGSPGQPETSDVTKSHRDRQSDDVPRYMNIERVNDYCRNMASGCHSMGCKLYKDCITRDIDNPQFYDVDSAHEKIEHLF